MFTVLCRHGAKDEPTGSNALLYIILMYLGTTSAKLDQWK
jgi:hypothetical protein